VISDFAVLGGQRALYGLVASVPTAWRTLDEIAAAGPGAVGDHHGAQHRGRYELGAEESKLTGPGCFNRLVMAI
jgi:hypothetical protein